MFATLSNDDVLTLLNDANVNGDDVQYDACYEELVKRDALPYDLQDDFECYVGDEDADLESYSLECCFGPEE